MTMLPVLDFHEIWLISTRYIWHVFMVIWYLDKDWNISNFEIEFGFFVFFTKNIDIL